MIKTIKISNEFILEVEDYDGSTIQAFKLSTDNIKIEVIDIFYQASEHKSLDSFGIEVEFDNKRMTISSTDYELADVTEDYLFDTSLDLVRFQKINEN